MQQYFRIWILFINYCLVLCKFLDFAYESYMGWPELEPESRNKL